MHIETANAERLALDAAALALEPPPPVDYVPWTESNSAFTERKSYFDEPLGSLSRGLNFSAPSLSHRRAASRKKTAH
jgi:hypothetical protein